jgi:hypothetical protein
MTTGGSDGIARRRSDAWLQDTCDTRDGAEEGTEEGSSVYEWRNGQQDRRCSAARAQPRGM